MLKHLVYCVSPKSGTTSWQSGMQVLKDREEGVIKKPEDYVPDDLFKNERLNPQHFQMGSFHPTLGDTGVFQS